jgi:hypothetical protein
MSFHKKLVFVPESQKKQYVLALFHLCLIKNIIIYKMARCVELFEIKERSRRSMLIFS